MLTAGTLTVQRNLVITKNGPILQDPKTKLSARVVNVPTPTIRVLREHRTDTLKAFFELGIRITGDDLVFSTIAGKPINPHDLTKNFTRIAKEMETKGHPKLTLHGLRHTYATLALEAGADVLAVSENLGHHSTGFTLSVYGHVTAKMKKEASEKMGNLMASCFTEDRG